MHTDQPYSEQDLVAGIRRGDQKAEYILYKRYVDAMYHTALRIVGGPAEAQDVVQESFIKIFRKIGSYRSEATIGAWMKRIVVNTAINSIRKAQRIPEFYTEETPEIPDIDDENISPLWTPKQIHGAILELPAGCRTILNMYTFEGYSHKEIAGFLGITESTSKTQYRRAKGLLKETLNSIKRTDED